MSAPTAKVRKQVYDRDGNRCVSCGTTYGLQAHHRQATGLGGRIRRPTPSELLTACGLCNASYEADKQSEALLWGIKVRRNIGGLTPADIPVFYLHDQGWFLLDDEGNRKRCLPDEKVMSDGAD